MAQPVTLAELRVALRELVDEESSSSGASSLIAAPELDRRINEAIPSYYNLLVGACGQEYFVKKHSWELEADVAEYSLPLDFFSALAFEMQYDRWYFEIFSWTQQDTARLRNLRELGGWGYAYLLWAHDWMRYRIQGPKVELLPAPNRSDAYTLHLRYVPTVPKLIEAQDEIDGVNGWEKYVYWHAAIPILMKGETDTTDARRQLAMIEAEIRAHAPKRDRGRPEVVQDTAQDDWVGVGMGYGNRLVRE
jgi:hypothetical protein